MKYWKTEASERDLKVRRKKGGAGDIIEERRSRANAQQVKKKSSENGGGNAIWYRLSNKSRSQESDSGEASIHCRCGQAEKPWTSRRRVSEQVATNTAYAATHPTGTTTRRRQLQGKNPFAMSHMLQLCSSTRRTNRVGDPWVTPCGRDINWNLEDVRESTF